MHFVTGRDAALFRCTGLTMTTKFIDCHVARFCSVYFLFYFNFNFWLTVMVVQHPKYNDESPRLTFNSISRTSIARLHRSANESTIYLPAWIAGTMTFPGGATLTRCTHCPRVRPRQQLTSRREPAIKSRRCSCILLLLSSVLEP